MLKFSVVGDMLFNKGIVNLFSCDSQKLYLILTFMETSFLICLNYHNIPVQKLLFLAPGFLYRNTCLNKICYSE